MSFETRYYPNTTGVTAILWGRLLFGYDGLSASEFSIPGTGISTLRVADLYDLECARSAIYYPETAAGLGTFPLIRNDRQLDYIRLESSGLGINHRTV